MKADPKNATAVTIFSFSAAKKNMTEISETDHGDCNSKEAIIHIFQCQRGHLSDEPAGNYHLNLRYCEFQLMIELPSPQVYCSGSLSLFL